MSTQEPQKLSDIQVDVDNLYREEIFTDLKVATIRCLMPVKRDGSADESREALYSGQTTVMTGAGALPVTCPIEAKSLEEAMRKFPEAAQQAVDRMVAELRELQRQEASRIVVPTTMPPGTPGVPGGGKIQLG